MIRRCRIIRGNSRSSRSRLVRRTGSSRIRVSNRIINRRPSRRSRRNRRNRRLS